MKALVPYAVLGVIGAAGVFVGSGASSSGTSPQPVTPPAPTAPTVTQSGDVRVHAALERTVLPAARGEVFARVALEGVQPAAASTQRVPVSLTLVIDRSGSMGSGSKMADARRAAREAIEALRVGDRACVVSFDNGAEAHGCATIRAPGHHLANEVGALLVAIDGLDARGGTDMIAGMDVGGRAALEIHGADRVNRVLLLSDGRPNTEEGLREQAGALAKKGVQTTTLGLGADYNEDLMAAIADQGLGHYFFVAEPAQLAQIFAQELESLASIVAREATVRIAPAQGARVVEVIGFSSHDDGSGAVVIPAGDVYGGRTTDVLVRLEVPDTKPRSSMGELVAVRVEYTPAAGGDRVAVARSLEARRSLDAGEIAGSAAPEVAAKVEKYRAAQAWLAANAAYDRGDKDAGDAIITSSSARLAEQAAALAAPELAAEAAEQKAYQVQNEQNGAGWRSVGTRAAKRKAWSMNKGSAY